MFKWFVSPDALIRSTVLRVVAPFPVDANLKRCLEEDPDVEGHPIATLNMNLLKQIVRKMSPIDFLQNIEEPLQHTGKLKDLRSA